MCCATVKRDPSIHPASALTCNTEHQHHLYRLHLALGAGNVCVSSIANTLTKHGHGRLRGAKRCVLLHQLIGPALSSRTCADQTCNGNWADLTTQEYATEATLVPILPKRVVHHEIDTCLHFLRTTIGSVRVPNIRVSSDQSPIR